jgi:Flp pilus assembly protein TadD
MQRRYAFEEVGRPAYEDRTISFASARTRALNLRPSCSYEAAARLMPDDGFVLATCAHFVSAMSGGGARAEPRFQRAIELARDDPFVRYAYGTHLHRAKRHAEARRELQLADSLGHPRAHERLAALDED